MEIRVDDLRGPEIAALIEEHLAEMAVHSPPESRHALDLEALRHPSITFWSVWIADELVGCGALQQLDAQHAEVKSMRTARAHQRNGVAAFLLTHLLEEARQRGYERVSLETGSMKSFQPAHRLYEKFGFERCGPFSFYMEDPNKIFMTRTI